jgi:ferredoxin
LSEINESEATTGATARVVFEGTGIVATVPIGTYLIDAARDAGLDVPQQCGGFAICSWCRMTVLHGAASLSLPTFGEERLRSWEMLGIDERASCQSVVLDDLTVSATYW